MANSTTETIKEKLDIVEFLKDYLSLQSAGKNFKALCPFHKEKTPSFMISPERQTWRCFGCDLGGDIFAFIMRYENLEFAEALKVLAEKAGVELRRLAPADYKFFGLLYDLNESAKKFFQTQLQRSPEARQYLSDRGLNVETIKEFELGFAPPASDNLNLYLINAGYRPEDILRAGLAIKSEKGAQFDRFRGRIMFPIYNNFGKVVGFTGRVLPKFESEKFGKYVNSPETPIFNKSRLLYGFHKSKNFIRENKEVLLVEGQMDFLMSWQTGIKNVVASSGTALTSPHLNVLHRLADRIILSFDNDEAGWSAGERAIDLAESLDFDVRVIVFNKFKDAAEAVKADPKNLKDFVINARPAMEFYFSRYLPEGHPDYSNRKEIRNLRVILGKINNISTPVGRSFWLKELSRRVGVAEKILIEESEKVKEKKNSPSLQNKENEDILQREKFSRKDVISQKVLSAALGHGSFEVVEDVVSYLSPEYQKILEIIRTGGRSSDDPRVDEIIDLIVLKSEKPEEKEMVDLKINLFQEHLKKRRNDITHRIRLAESVNDEGAINSALQELNNLNSSNVEFN